MTEARSVAQALHERYDPPRAVTLIARLINKALFAGRSDEVVFWATVFAHYRGDGLSAGAQAELDAFRDAIFPGLAAAE